MCKELHLIVGNSGSGKSSALYESLLKEAQEHEERRYFLIVPEQYTMQAQRDVVERSARHGTLNIDIVSFMRLSYRIFEELGTSLSTVLEDHGKSMLLRRVLGQVDAKLAIYRGMKDKPGFIDQVKSMLSEFYQYEVHEGELRELLSCAPEESMLWYKLSDLLCIYECFSASLSERYQVSEQLLDVFCEVAPQSRLLKDASFYFDGFTGFTPLQYRVIQCLMEQGRDCYFTITMDKNAYYAHTDVPNLFSLSKKTYRRLLECHGQAGGVDGEVERVLLFEDVPKRFFKAPDLTALEAGLFRDRGGVFSGETAHVRIWEAKSTRAEVHAVAARIRELVDTEGYRYRQIAVVSANTQEYGELCQRIFAQYDIPVFLDARDRLLNHPYVEALRAVLAIVSKGRQGYTYDRMMRYLYTGLAGITREEAQLLDNYVTATNTIGIQAWQNGFTRLPKSYWLRGRDSAAREKQEQRRTVFLQERNALRAQVMRSLTPLQRAMDQATGVCERVDAIVAYMESLHYETRLAQRAQELFEKGEYVLAKTWENMYGSIIGLLQKLKDILGEEQDLSNTEFAAIIDAGLSELSLGSVPPTMDEVMVGDFIRSRLNQIRALFVMGLNDTNVPSRTISPNLLTDRDRLQLKEASVELAPDSSAAAYEEQFYLYLALTRPSEQLVLSYARMDASGTALRPSYLLDRVLRILPKTPRTVVESEAYLKTPGTVYPWFLQELKKLSKGETESLPALLTVYRLCLEEPEYASVLHRLRQAMAHTNEEAPLPRELARRLFGERLELSVTRLEQYSSCAFAHFLNYGLGLKEREQYRFENVDFGTVLHKIAELFGRRVQQEQISYESLTQEQIFQMTQECVAQALEDEGYDLTRDGARSQYTRHTIERVAQRTMRVLCRHLKLGRFVPEAFELTFGPNGEIPGPVYTMDTGEPDRQTQILLRGTIDRLDVLREETPDGLKRAYLKVVDYKTGNLSLDLTRVYYGLQLQLLTYVMVAQDYYPVDAERIAAAALYYHIQDPLVEHTLTLYQADEQQRQAFIDTVERDAARVYAMNGIVREDDAVLSNLEQHAEGKYRYESIPVSYNTDGTLSKTSQCQSPQLIDALLDHTREQIVSLGERMLCGEVSANPYEYKGRRPCTYCPYSTICQFEDKSAKGLRVLQPKDEDSFTGGDA